jgi:hypothetical protein
LDLYDAVIAGLDPAIHTRDCPFGITLAGCGSTDAVSLDRRVKPGDDNRVVIQTYWIPI